MLHVWHSDVGRLVAVDSSEQRHRSYSTIPSHRLVILLELNNILVNVSEDAVNTRHCGLSVRFRLSVQKWNTALE